MSNPPPPIPPFAHPAPPLPVYPPASPLSYHRFDSWSGKTLKVGPSSVPMAALVMALVHATWAAVLAVYTGVAMRQPDGREYEPLCWMLGLLLPTGGLVLLLGILGHGYVGGRRLAGPAMWIVGIVPGAAVILHLLAAALASQITALGSLYGLAVIVVDLIIVLALRNRILKAPSGPLPVIPIMEGESPLPPGRMR